jgi:hypothetical protein
MVNLNGNVQTAPLRLIVATALTSLGMALTALGPIMVLDKIEKTAADQVFISDSPEAIEACHLDVIENSIMTSSPFVQVGSYPWMLRTERSRALLIPRFRLCCQ